MDYVLRKNTTDKLLLTNVISKFTNQKYSQKYVLFVKQNFKQHIRTAYTAAQNVGFGVIDPAREGLNNTCTFNNQGTIISFPPAAGN